VREPRNAVSLDANEVHLWWTCLDRTQPPIRSFLQLLASDERARAARFRFEEHRRVYVAVRGLLRVILSRYLQIEPARIELNYGPHGKPELADSIGDHSLAFNVSHSEKLALFGIARRREIGVDVERIRADIEVRDLAKTFFSPEETAALLSLPEELWSEAFFACWTRKEAYLKARGDGLSVPLDQFTVTLAPNQPAALLHSWLGRDEPQRWSIRDVEPTPGYAGAIAVNGRDWRLRQLCL
jgi:4'-phosphopantetheinyl transferase